MGLDIPKSESYPDRHRARKRNGRLFAALRLSRVRKLSLVKGIASRLSREGLRNDRRIPMSSRRYKVFDVFVIMPFDEKFKRVEEGILRAATGVHNATTCGRLSRITEAGKVTDQLYREIRGCRMCIADITGKNSNVLWETGYAMGLEKDVIFVSQEKPEENPFDLRNERTIRYDIDDLDGTLERPLKAAVKATLSKTQSFTLGPPFSKTLGLVATSPVYVLDDAWIVRRMNYAAELVFGIESEQFLDAPLKKFVYAVKKRILNKERVLKNLADQEQEIRSLLRKGRPQDIVPHNFETVFFDSLELGPIRLEKYGVAVKEEPGGPPTGWVVHFDVRSVLGDREKHYDKIRTSIETSFQQH